MQKNDELPTVTIHSLVFQHLFLIIIAFILAYISYSKAMATQNGITQLLSSFIAFLFISTGVFFGLEIILKKIPVISITPEKLRYSDIFRRINLARDTITAVKAKRKFLMSFLEISYHKDNVTIPMMGFSKTQTEEVVSLLKPL